MLQLEWFLSISDDPTPKQWLFLCNVLTVVRFNRPVRLFATFRWYNNASLQPTTILILILMLIKFFLETVSTNITICSDHFKISNMSSATFRNVLFQIAQPHYAQNIELYSISNISKCIQIYPNISATSFWPASTWQLWSLLQVLPSPKLPDCRWPEPGKFACNVGSIV